MKKIQQVSKDITTFLAKQDFKGSERLDDRKKRTKKKQRQSSAKSEGGSQTSSAAPESDIIKNNNKPEWRPFEILSQDQSSTGKMT